MSNFGAIPTEVICRFHELTKTEIIVLSYLYSRRNRGTNKCNPRQAEIAKAVGINKSHVCTAMKNLSDRGWICEQDDKNILLTIPFFKDRPTLPFSQPKVTNLVTVELPNPQPVVTESVTEVTKSVTESYENGNSLIKETNKERTKKEQRSEQGAHTLEALSIYKQFFPLNDLSIGQQEMIEVRVTDLLRWSKTLEYWSGNDYRAQSIFKMLDYYDELGLQKNGNNNKKSNPGRQRNNLDSRSDQTTSDYLASIGANPKV